MITEAAHPAARKKRQRDYSRAEWLRPSDVFAIYGISTTTTWRWCVAGHVRSVRFGGTKGRKGTRLIEKASVDAYIEREMRRAS